MSYTQGTNFGPYSGSQPPVSQVCRFESRFDVLCICVGRCYVIAIEHRISKFLCIVMYPVGTVISLFHWLWFTWGNAVKCCQF